VWGGDFQGGVITNHRIDALNGSLTLVEWIAGNFLKIPTTVMFTNAGTTVFVCDKYLQGVHVFARNPAADGSLSYRSFFTLPLSDYFLVQAMAISRDDSFLWISVQTLSANQLLTFDLQKLRLLQTLNVSCVPNAPAWSQPLGAVALAYSNGTLTNLFAASSMCLSAFSVAFTGSLVPVASYVLGLAGSTSPDPSISIAVDNSQNQVYLSAASFFGDVATFVAAFSYSQS
jgi:hypothetical protein